MVKTLVLKQSKITSGVRLKITGSKSESNRALILKALYSNIELVNLSNSDDTRLLQQALTSKQETVDIHHAGTAMRFLTAYFAAKDHKTICLTGSSRMKERPIEVLVNALRGLGADIQYLENEGFPPIMINGRSLNENYTELKANVSSQYISALLLVAPSLKNGLRIRLIGKITSRPYIEMTLSLLNRIGVKTDFQDNDIVVNPLNQIKDRKTITVESDWSSASYYYSLISLSEPGTSVHLYHYFKDSLQGDSVLQEIYRLFGVETQFTETGITILKSQQPQLDQIKLDLAGAPDIAQTIVVTCFGLGMSCHLTGLHTLKIKETDRLEALRTELTKLGAQILVTKDSLTLKKTNNYIEDQMIQTYNDHRMAMAFTPLALVGGILIEDPEVVSKSYPDFWKDLETLGIDLK